MWSYTYCNEMETFSSRGKLLIHLALQKPNKCFHEYKKSEYMIGSRTEEIGVNLRNRTPTRRKYQVDDIDVEEDDPYTCYATKICERECGDPKTLRKVSDILTPPKSKKRIILDTPDGTATDEREKRKMSNGAASVVKTLYNDITNVLNTYDDLARPFDDDVCDDVFAEVPDDTQVVSFSDDIDVNDDTRIVYVDHNVEVVDGGDNIQIGVIDVGDDVQVNNLNESTTPLNKKKYTKLKTPEARYERDIKKHPLLPPCEHRKESSKKGCGKDCNSKFSLAERQQIHTEFWSISYDERESWLGRVVQTKSPARPRKFSHGLRSKTETRLSTLFSASGENIPVCKTFFLSTLGLNSDKMIKTGIAKRKGSFIKIIPDQRGRRQPPHKLNDTTTEVIKNHIYSYGPFISHYRRAHAPNRLYLSPECNSQITNAFKCPEHTTLVGEL